jgi:hypothetical protein
MTLETMLVSKLLDCADVTGAHLPESKSGAHEYVGGANVVSDERQELLW